MATAYFSKVVSTLPSPLVANTIYCVRTGVGFDFYLTDMTGSIAYQTNASSNARTINALSQSSGTVTVDLSLSGIYTLTLTQNLTAWNFTNLPAAGQMVQIRIELTQNATTAYTCQSPVTGARTAGGAWAVSAALGAIESLWIAVDHSGTVTLSPGGVYA